VVENLRQNASLAQTIVKAAAERVGAMRPSSSSHQALRSALMTPKEQVSPQTRQRLDLFTTPYWGPFSA
jgi:5'-methylthioadenosine phosphorylase